MFFTDLDDTIITRRSERAARSLSAPEQAIQNCSRINWYLYRAKYILGEGDFDQLTSAEKKDVLDGFIKYVINVRPIRTDEVELMSLSTHPYMRRARFMR